MIDLHSHLLPAVDDGSQSVEASHAVLLRMRSEGITDVCLTPHIAVAELHPERLRAKLGKHESAFASLKENAPLVPALHRGAELMLDQSPSSVAEIPVAV